MTDRPTLEETHKIIGERVKAIRAEAWFNNPRRRERLEVAARIMAGMCANKLFDDLTWPSTALQALEAADALIARVDGEGEKA